MSSPHVAGAAAVMAQRNRDEDLGLESLDLGALLANYALPVVNESGPESPVVGVSRQGAGRVDLLRAGTGDLLIRAGDIAGISLGYAAFDGIRRFEGAVAVTNLGAEAARLSVVPSFADATGADAVEVIAPDTLVVEPGATESFEIGFQVNGAHLADWPYGFQGDAVTAEGMDAVELDGWLAFVHVDAAGEPLADAVSPQVPFLLIARPAARVSTRGIPEEPGNPSPELRFANPAANDGRAELYWRLASDPEEDTVRHELDLVDVGVRYRDRRLEFLLHTAEPMTLPQVTSVEVYIDTDTDGAADRRVRAGPEKALTGSGSDDRMVVVAGQWDAEAEAVVGPESVVGGQPVDLFTRVPWFSVPFEAVGLDAPQALGLSVVHRGLTEDWIGINFTDRVPDQGLATFDPAVLPWQLEAVKVPVPARGEARVAVVPAAQNPDQGLLAAYPDNPPQRQLVVVDQSADPRPDRFTAHLPLVVREHWLKPRIPGDDIHDAIDALNTLEGFKMVLDTTDKHNPMNANFRNYEFERGIGSYVVTRPKDATLQDQEQRIRWDEHGYFYETQPVGNWVCGPVLWFMFLRGELVDRLHTVIPRIGWEPTTGRHGPELVSYRAVDADQGITYFATIRADGGPPMTLSITQGDPIDPQRREVYRFEDFNDPAIEVQRPRGANCGP